MKELVGSIGKWIITELKTVMGWLGFTAAISILASIGCYFAGTTANWVIIACMVAGMWAFNKIAPHFKPVTNMACSLLWYAGTFIVGYGTLYVALGHTVLGMYNDWADFHHSFIGFIRIYAPMIVLTIGSCMIASTSEGRGWSRRVVIAGSIVCAICLLLYGFVESADKWLAVFKNEKAQDLDQDAAKRTARMGLFVTVDKTGIKTYNEIDKNAEYEVDKVLTVGVRYPIVNKEDQRTDGPHKLVKIYLPTTEGDFSGKSDQLWVRLDEVELVSNQKPKASSNGQIIFSHEYTGQGFGKNQWVQTADFGTDIKIGYKYTIKGTHFEVYNSGRWQDYSGECTLTNRTGTTGSLGIKAAKGEKFKVEVLKT